MRPVRLAAVAAIALALAAGAAHAQTYPNKPVKLINGFQPGGPTDVIGRILADHLTKTMGQQFIVEAKPGAAGNLAGEIVVNSPPDGYTLYIAASGVLVANHALYGDRMSYDPAVAFTPISILVRIPMPLDVNVKVPVKSYQEFIAYAKANPGKLNHGSPGIGSVPHLAAELFKKRIGFVSEHVPYRGSGPFMTGISQGEVQWGFDGPSTALQAVRNNAINVVAISGVARDSNFPDAPTLEELGMKDADWTSFFALMGPAKLRKDIVDKLYAEIARGWRDPEVAARL
ncbi:MAG TPA: tripartite tricarboxylate transporter substrate binding protein, partial [Alphaproteobacteria bacterium]